MKKIYTVFVCFLIVCAFASAQNTTVLKQIFLAETTRPTTNLKETAIIHIDPTFNFKSIQSQPELIIKNFPVRINQTSTIKLRLLNSIIDENTQITAGNNTKNVKVDLPVLSRYSGKIVGDDNSDVFMTIINDAMYCRVNDGQGEEYTITPPVGNSTGYTMVNNKNNVQEKPLACSTIEPPNFIVEVEKYKANKVFSNATLKVDVAVDICKEWFLWKFPGDTIKIRDYILSVYSLVSYVYEKDINVTVRIPWLHIWTSMDPYNNETTWLDRGPATPTILDNIGAYWKTHNLSVKANLIHVLTVGKIGGGGGVGYFNALASGIHDGNKWGAFTAISCGAEEYPLSIQPILNYNFDVGTVAHEMGHNFDCPHTHSCSWNPAIDTCETFEGIRDGCFSMNQQSVRSEGSIMSYCHAYYGSNKMVFLSKPAKLMRTYAEKYLKEVNLPATKPAAPTLYTPIGNAKTVSLSPGFKWLKSDITISYHLQLSKSDQFDNLVKDTIINFDTLTIIGLDESTDYFWRVAAQNFSGEGLYSDIRQFRTGILKDFLQPEIITSKEMLDFGDVKLSTSKELTFNIYPGNAADLPLDSLSFFGATGSFFIKNISKNLPAILTQMDTIAVSVSFIPKANDKMSTATLQAYYHDKENRVMSSMIELMGNVLQPFVSTSLGDKALDFGNVLINTTKEMTFDVFSGNAADLPLDSIAFFDDAGSFAIKNISVKLPAIVKNSNVVTVKVAFTPKKGDTKATTSIIVYWRDLGNQEQLSIIDVEGSLILTGVNENGVVSNGDLSLSIEPNPLTNKGLARFNGKIPQNIKLSLFNIFGQEVAVLFNGMSDMTMNTTLFDVSAFPSGIYQAVLYSNSGTVSLPIVVVK